MKKWYKTIAVALCALLAFAASGCRGELLDDEKPDDKIGIYLEVYQGGHGKAWADRIAKSFNETVGADSDYYVVVSEARKATNDIITEIRSGNSKDIYMPTTPYFQSGIYEGLLEDLSDLAASPAYGETEPIIEKMRNRDEISTVFSDLRTGKGLYALPLMESINGMLYDHTLFVEKGFYTFATQENDGTALTAQGISYNQGTGQNEGFLLYSTQVGEYKAGDKILTAGKDGLYGTFDDGQPKNLTEWNTMLEKIRGASGANGNPMRTFMWAGGVNADLDWEMAALLYKLGGIDDYETYFRYDSKGKDALLQDNVTKKITYENGNEVWQLQSLLDSYQFIRENLLATPSVDMHSANNDNNTTHLAAQKLFLMGYMGVPSVDEAAFFYDGSWWEYEAKLTNTFSQLAENYNAPDRAYGKREYRYMILPDFENQKLEKSVIASSETSPIIVPKKSNNSAEKKEMIMEFLKFFLSDANLSLITGETGTMCSYDYELLPVDEAMLTPFSRNVRDIYFSDNVEIVRPRLAQIASPINFLTQRGTVSTFPIKLSNTTKILTCEVFTGQTYFTTAQIKAGLKTTYTSQDWSGFVNICKQNGFYVND